MNLISQSIKQALNGDFEAAVKTNLEIIKKDAKNIDALNRLAFAYLQLGKKEKAKTVYNQVLRLDRFNPIARRNLEKMKNFTHSKNKNLAFLGVNFLEEPGKTQLIVLVCPGETKALVKLSVRQPLRFITRGKTLSLYNEEKEYIGRLPDDLSRRLIWLTKRGNKYESFVKSVDRNRVTVFLREVQQVKINRNHISFPPAPSQSLKPFLSNKPCH